MTNIGEAKRWFKEARVFLERGRKLLNFNDWPGGVHNCQMCVEFSAKGIISYFSEPDWTHDPSEQLAEVIHKMKDKITPRMVDSLQRIVEDSHEAATWHGRSTYGEMREGRWIPASELCTEEIAKDLLEMAERSYNIAQDFLREYE